MPTVSGYKMATAASGYRATALVCPPRASAARPAAAGSSVSSRGVQVPRCATLATRRPAAAAYGRPPREQRENPIIAFLGQACLLHYADALFRMGFTDLETLVEISDEDLAQCNMPRGHVIRLRRALEAFGGPTLAPAGAATAPQPQPMHAPTLAPAGALATPPQPQPIHAPTLAPGGAVMAAPQPMHGLAAPAGALAAPLQPAMRAARSQEENPEALALASVLQAIEVQPAGPSEAELTVVQMSWERVKLIGIDKVGGVMYEQFLKVEPGIKAFFPREVRAKYQTWTCDEASCGEDLRDSAALRALFGKKLAVLGYFIAGSSKKNMLPRIKMMGMRHAEHGRGLLNEEHFEKMEKALLRALKKTLAEHFTRDVEVAWATVFQFVAAIIQCGHREAMGIKAKAEAEAKAKAEAAQAQAQVEAARARGQEAAEGKPSPEAQALSRTASTVSHASAPAMPESSSEGPMPESSSEGHED